MKGTKRRDFIKFSVISTPIVSQTIIPSYSQIKVPLDYDKLMTLISHSTYSGYLPLETLNANPMEKIPIMMDEIKKWL